MRKKYERNLIIDLDAVHTQIKDMTDKDPRKPTIRDLLTKHAIDYQLFYNQMSKWKANRSLLLKLYDMWINLPVDALMYIWVHKLQNT